MGAACKPQANLWSGGGASPNTGGQKSANASVQTVDMRNAVRRVYGEIYLTSSDNCVELYADVDFLPHNDRMTNCRRVNDGDLLRGGRRGEKVTKAALPPERLEFNPTVCVYCMVLWSLLGP